jgi:uncharacterized protein (TIGR01370 family)
VADSATGTAVADRGGRVIDASCAKAHASDMTDSPMHTPIHPTDRRALPARRARPSSARRFTRATACLVVLASIALVACRSDGSGSRVGRLRAARSFAFGLGLDLDDTRSVRTRLAAYDLVVIDGEDASKALVDGLRADGALVLAYVSVGTIESYRSWHQAASPFKLELWDDWGEWYADTSKAGFRNLITGKAVPPMLAKGFDGLFLDNVDMISDHKAQTDGMYTLVRDLSRLVHADGRLLFAQNGEEIIDPILDELDGWNHEDVTSTYDWDSEGYVAVPAGDTRDALSSLRRIKEAGVVTTTADYTAAYTPMEKSSLSGRAVANACSVGALPFVSDIDLSRVPTTPARCG